MLLITGPSGNVGNEVVSLLAERSNDAAWRVASRHTDELRTRLGDTSAEVVALDFFDRSTWTGALDGVDTLFLLFPFANRLRRRDVGWDTIAFMCAVYTLTRLGRNQPTTVEVSRLLSRPPRTLAEFLHDSAWRWRDRVWT
jgi:nucleoside-diphosphate-sugar epimerase